MVTIIGELIDTLTAYDVVVTPESSRPSFQQVVTASKRNSDHDEFINLTGPKG